MNKKAGFLISAIIIFISLAIGIFIGWNFNDNAAELTALEEQNNQLRGEVENLQNQIESQDNELDECVQKYSERYPEAVRNFPSQYGIKVTFSNLLSFNDIKLFADKYGVWEGGVSGSDNNGNYLGAQFTTLSENDSIIEKFCLIEQDETVKNISIVGPFTG